MMVLLLLSYLGGVLTIVSPCILPVLPFVFARADRPFLRNGLPMLVGMAVTFAAIATLAAVGGGWAVAANEYGRIAALVLLAVFGLTLLFPAFSVHLSRPFVALGARLSQSTMEHEGASQRSAILSSLLFGVATGLLWAPCAGPILGLILTGAALQGANVGTSLLLFAYALGAATSLALALAIGGRLFAQMKSSLGISEWIRRGLGAAVLIAVVAVAFGFDTGFLTRVSLVGTSGIEQRLLDTLHPQTMAPSRVSSAALRDEGAMPSLSGATAWINSPPLRTQSLRGNVVLIDFWTYSCINCLRSLPYIEAWAAKYKDQGLVVIGVHSPEFAFEKNVENVRKAVADLKVEYPVAVDSNYAIWEAFNNQYWPADYLIDAKGRIRYHYFGEGDYPQTEAAIRELLAEAGRHVATGDAINVAATGVEAPADMNDVQSPETYIGYTRSAGFISAGGIKRDTRYSYATRVIHRNDWGLLGAWTIGGESATSDAPESGIVYRFHARDLHLVLGPSADGKPVRFRVTLDGKAPGASHGTDIDAAGNGVVTGQRLYQLIRENGKVTDRVFSIQFLDSGVHAYAFTFG